jgi:hypothetical protein
MENVKEFAEYAILEPHDRRVMANLCAVCPLSSSRRVLCS